MKVAALAVVSLLFTTPTDQLFSFTPAKPPADVVREGRVRIVADMDEDLMKAVVAGVTKLVIEDKQAEVNLYIDSGGGGVVATTAAIAELKLLKAGHPFTMVCRGGGMVASAAAMFFEAVCDHREVFSFTVVLFHRASTQVRGNRRDLMKAVEVLDKLDLAAASVVAPRLGMTPAEYLAKLDEGDWVLTADKALEAKAVDSVVNP